MPDEPNSRIRPQYLQIEARIGMRFVYQMLNPEVLYSTNITEPTLAQMLIDGLVTKANKEGLPLKCWDQQWVGITGYDGLDSVIGNGYRGFREDDFQVYGGYHQPRCSLCVLPRTAIAQLCDKPECKNWARTEYRVEASPISKPGVGHFFWGKTRMIGDIIKACPPHAYELYRDNPDLGFLRI